jgi:hypothetical protein
MHAQRQCIEALYCKLLTTTLRKVVVRNLTAWARDRQTFAAPRPFSATQLLFTYIYLAEF